MTYYNQTKPVHTMSTVKQLLHWSLQQLLIVLFMLFSFSAFAAEPQLGFDHFSTGFPLTGKHQFVDCSSCHLYGQFKGTPMECVLCHNNSRAEGKHPQHFPSNNICDNCHRDDSWKGARFDHGDVQGECQSCHNNITAVGLSPSHIPSSTQCDDCHNTLLFDRIGRVDHNSVRGSCTSCHNGIIATGKHPAHFQTIAECDNCHNTNTWLGATNFDHSTASSACSTCHNGVIATGKHPAHMPTTAECGFCHVSTNSWANAIFDHPSVMGRCDSCHNGIIAIGKSNSHFVTTEDCASCHMTTNWIPITFRHSSANYPGDHANASNCSDCHTSNNQIIPWPSPAFAPECAACHERDYRFDKHKNTPVADLADCAGSCHFDGPKSGEHRASSREW